MMWFWTGCALILLGGIGGLSMPPSRRGTTAVVGLISGNLIIAGVAGCVLVQQQSLAFSLPFMQGGQPWVMVDGLSAFFMMAIVLLGSIGGVYGLGYLKSYHSPTQMKGLHWFCWNMLILALLGVVTFQQTLAFLVSWEFMLMFTLLLVFFEHEKSEVSRAGMYYLIAMHLSFFLLVMGFSLCVEQGGSWFFADFQVKESSVFLRTWIFALLGLGFGLKAGLMPLHTWLPHAHPVAPSHVSALMSGIVIKMGIYGIFRMLTFLGTPERVWGEALLLMAMISAIGGVAYALAQHDLKRLLAYHSVENIGIIGIGIGIGMLGWQQGSLLVMNLGFAGALLHVWNHAIFKGLLFLGAGTVYQATHTRNLEQYGGLAKRLPKTAFSFLIGAAAICGLPPLNGFVSEFLIYQAMIRSFPQHPSLYTSLVPALSIAGLSVVGGLALTCFSKAYGCTFLGKPRSQAAAAASECSPTMWSGMALLAGLCLAIGLFPHYAVSLLSAPLAAFSQAEPFRSAAIAEQLEPIAWAASGFVLLFLLLWGWRWQKLRITNYELRIMKHEAGTNHNQLSTVKQRLSELAPENSLPTWDCGYRLDSPRLQYTASSFADPLLSLGNAGLNIHVQQHLPEGVFPSHAAYESHCSDWFDTKMISVPWKRFHQLLLALARTQSGSTPIYLLYGLIYLGLISLLAISGVL